MLRDVVIENETFPVGSKHATLIQQQFSELVLQCIFQGGMVTSSLLYFLYIQCVVIYNCHNLVIYNTSNIMLSLQLHCPFSKIVQLVHYL